MIRNVQLSNRNSIRDVYANVNRKCALMHMKRRIQKHSNSRTKLNFSSSRAVNDNVIRKFLAFEYLTSISKFKHVDQYFLPWLWRLDDFRAGRPRQWPGKKQERRLCRFINYSKGSIWNNYRVRIELLTELSFITSPHMHMQCVEEGNPSHLRPITLLCNGKFDACGEWHPDKCTSPSQAHQGRSDGPMHL